VHQHIKIRYALISKKPIYRRGSLELNCNGLKIM
jgi:hypothetical protein